MLTRTLLAVVAGLALAAASVNAQTLLDPSEAAKSVQIENLKVSGNEISGIVMNKSPHVVRNVELRMKYNWLWNNEFHPGTDSLGRVFTITLDRELRPGESAPFTFRPEPLLSARSDGYYMPEVSVAGFSVVIPPTMAQR